MGELLFKSLLLLNTEVAVIINWGCSFKSSYMEESKSGPDKGSWVLKGLFHIGQYSELSKVEELI